MNYSVSIRGSFLSIKHFMWAYRQASCAELAAPAIVLTETETETAPTGGKAGLHYGPLNTVRDEIKSTHADRRINSVNPYSRNGLAGEVGATPADVARAMASNRAAGHISGQCIRVDGGNKDPQPQSAISSVNVPSVPQALSKPKHNKIRVAVSIDLDAVSGWLRTSMSIPISEISRLTVVSQILTPTTFSPTTQPGSSLLKSVYLVSSAF